MTTAPMRHGASDPIAGLDAAINHERQFSARAVDRAFTLAAGRAAWLIGAALPDAHTLIFAHVMDETRCVWLEAVRGAAGELLWYGYSLSEDPEALALDAVGGPRVRQFDGRTQRALADMWAGVPDPDRPPLRRCTLQGATTDDASANLLALDVRPAVAAMAAAMAVPGDGRALIVDGPDHERYSWSLTGDDTLVVLIDGEPTIGVDAEGAGRWRDGGRWERLRPGGTTTSREVVVLGMNEHQFNGLAALLGRPKDWFGRFMPEPGQRRDVFLNSRSWSCGSDAGLDVVIAYVRNLGLVYEEVHAVRYRPQTDGAEGQPSAAPS